MNRQDFFATRAELHRTIEHRTVASLVVGLLVLVAGIPLFLRSAQGLPSWIRLIGLLIPLAVGTGGTLLSRHQAFIRAQQLGIVCPKCGANLLWASLAGDRCSQCTSLVFAESATAPLPTRLEFYDRVNALDDAQSRLWLLVGGTFAGMVGAALLAELLLHMLHIPEPAWSGAVAALIIIVSIVVPILFAGHRWEVLVGRLGLRCPNCNEPVVGGSADAVTRQTMRTGKCPSCGATVMTEAT